jgi:cell division protein FtsW (lipid II flippase)
VPYADPYVLPIAALLTAVGLTEIYRLGPSDAFKQATWVVVGVAVFALALFALRRDYRALENYKYLFGLGAIALLFLPCII